MQLVRHDSHAAAFCAMSIAYTTPYTLITSLLSHWTGLLGPRSLLWLNIAYYLPSLPVLGAQLKLGPRLDALLSPVGAHACRAAVGYGGSAALLSLVPSLPLAGPWLLLLATAALGITSAVAFGSSYQLVAMGFPERDSAALTTGFVASAPLLLIVQGLLQIGPSASSQQLSRLFSACAALTLAGGAAAAIVLRTLWLDERQRRQAAEAGRLLRVHSSQTSLDSESPHGSEAGGSGGSHSASIPSHSRASSVVEIRNPLLPGSSLAPGVIELEPLSGASHSGSGGGDGGGPSCSPTVSPQQLELAECGLCGSSDCGSSFAACRGSALWPLWPAAAALALSICSSQLLFPFFSFAQSAQSSWPRFGALLPQVLFWARCLCDAAARVVPWPVPDPRLLLAAAALKTALVAPAFAYLAGSLTQNDLLATLYVALQWLASGWINVCALKLGPRLAAPGDERAAASLMTLAFQAASLAGLLAAIPLQALV